jgi:D-amino-acid dehydrogenase
MDLGVKFHFSTPVVALTQGPGLQIRTASLGTQDFEHVVVCAGAGAAAVATPPLKLPLTLLWSYTLSAQLREPLNAPRSAVLEPHSGIAISRMGARIRVSGGAELGSSQHSHSQKGASQNLYRALQTHFPGAADFSRSIQLWSGASVFSPDALPLLGASSRPGLWLNLAHGHNGWSMACGAARVLADQMGGRASDVDTTLMQPGRFKT